MNEEKYKLYDTIANVAVINLYSLSKENKKIIFNKIKFNNKAHLCLLKISESLRQVVDFDIYSNNNRVVLFIKNIKRKAKIFHSKEKGIDIDEFLNHISSAYKCSNGVGIFKDIYNEYYNTKKGDKNDL